jgi:transposase-like protein
LPIFKRRRFPIAIILLCVCWYCKSGISYRDPAELMSEHGDSVNPSTIFRWVQRYAPEIRSGCGDTRDIIQAHGEWMRLMCELAGAGVTQFGRSINTVD